MQKNKTLNSFLNDKPAQQKLIDNMINLVKTNKLDGLNLDFEYGGEPQDESLKDKYTQFAQNLSTQFRAQLSGKQLSIDTFPLSIRKPRMVDIASLSSSFDKVI